MTGQLGEQVNPPNPAAQPALRIGTVLDSPPVTSTTVWVEIFEGGDPVELPFQSGYVPVPGDLVNVLLLGGANTAGIVLGGRAGQSGNLVLNGDFTRIRALQGGVVPAGPPHLWGQYLASGTGQVVALLQPDHQMPMLGMFDNAASGTQYAYSAPFPVTPGETIKGDMVFDLVHVPTCSVTISLMVGWFNDRRTTWPAQLSESTLMASSALTFSTKQLLSGSAVAPALSSFARVAVKCVHTASGGGQYSAYVGQVAAGR